MNPRVEWDPAKNEANEARHGLSFAQASQLLLGDADYLEVYDQAGSIDEDRFIAIGPIEAGVIVVVFTERSDEVVRIISARRATPREVVLFLEHAGR